MICSFRGGSHLFWKTILRVSWSQCYTTISWKIHFSNIFLWSRKRWKFWTFVCFRYDVSKVHCGKNENL